MERCPRCSETVEAGWAYCPVCGRARILESLRAPAEIPEWKYQVLRVLVVVLAAWLVVTFGVAFLREAKAVRDARQLLAAGDPQAAWNTLGPFLNEHPEHKQALLLCAQANVLLGNLAKAGECFLREQAASEKLAATLKPVLGTAIVEKAASLGCDPETFKNLFGLAETVGNPDPREVERGLSGVVMACNGSGESEKLGDIAAFLAGKNRALEMVEFGFVPLIKQEENYWSARRWAQQAVSLVPESKEAVDAALARRGEGG